MKILTISNCPLVESQGSGYVIINFCRRLSALGHQVEVYGPEHYIPFRFMKSRANNYRITLGMVILALKKILRNKYDIIEMYGGPAWLIIMLLSMLPRRNFLIISHSNGIENHVTEVEKRYGSNLYNKSKWFQLNQDLLFKKGFSNAYAITTVSQYDAEFVRRNNFAPKERLAFVEIGLSDEYLNLPVQFIRDPCIGYCGSWISRKGIKVIEEDISRLLVENPALKFKLIGVGSDFRAEKYFKKQILQQIEVIPFIEDKKVLCQIYQTISILIVPSIYESFGLVTAEGMACGCAVVATRTGFAASLVHKKEIFLVDKPLSPYLLEGILALLRDDKLRVSIAMEGYKKVQNMNWEIAGQQLENMYSKWLSDWRNLKRQ